MKTKHKPTFLDRFFFFIGLTNNCLICGEECNVIHGYEDIKDCPNWTRKDHFEYEIPKRDEMR